MKKLSFLICFLILTIFVPRTFAQSSSFVSIVNPIRGADFWDIKNQAVGTAVLGQIEILNKFNLPATWLLRFDAVEDKNIIEALRKRPADEKGLFLEVTPSWANEAGVEYRQSGSWHAAGSAFLTGYERLEREKLIDAAFEKFKKTFGFYPLSAGAWWVDSYSLGYMQKKYGISASLIVADQYSTDNYQIWGQYFGTPYYPAKNNALHPAQSLENKLDIVMMQWAARDPVNSFGNGVMESTFSLQANDYPDYHNLDTNYFSRLIDTYTKQQFNRFAQVIVGLENSYEWDKYSDEYERQMEVLAGKRNSRQLEAKTMKDFAGWYKSAFPKLSPQQLIIADDPLGSFKKTVWFMNPYYRAGWFITSGGGIFRDIRQYVDGEEELCFKARCEAVNFATSVIRVLDDVSFGHKWLIDEGKISGFNVEKKGEGFLIGYKNEAGNLRQIGFLPRDISIDGKIFSIDAAILSATVRDVTAIKSAAAADSSLNWSFPSAVLKTFKFIIFILFAIILPGLVITKKALKQDTPFFLKIFMSTAVGFVMLAIVFYITGLIKIKPLIFVYLVINLILFLRFKIYSHLFNLPKIKQLFCLPAVLIILAGTVFQVIPTFKSGLTFGYGMGFWGPNTHDGVWHMALVNQLIKSVPPENPVYSATVLKNYHFFYDLLSAAASFLSTVPVADLVFRFYPVVFSVMLGIGSYYLGMRLFKSKIAVFFSLYLIYFAGSFGWIVEFLREGHFGGESAFWANQAVSFNLNPPFAASLIIIIALLHIIFSRPKNPILAILLAGVLIGFKSYGAVLVLASLLLTGLIKRLFLYLVIFAGAAFISLLIFLPNFDITLNLLVFAPFWFIHSMVDSPDRVGWVRLSLAREAGFAAKNWFKFISAEVLSLAIFIAGNLGVRAVSLLSLIKIKSIAKNEQFFFLFIFACLSFLIPILFIQSGNPWNTIQFTYYGLYIAALTSGIVLSKLPAPIIFIILVLAPINSVVTAGGYLGKNPHAYVSAKEMAGLQFLSGQPDGTVLTFPYDGRLKQKMLEPWPMLAYDSTAYVSALSKKPVYLEDEPQNRILLTDDKKRLVAAKDFFLKPLSGESKFLSDNKIQYIYLPKIYNIWLYESAKLKNIFENGEVTIYRVIN